MIRAPLFADWAAHVARYSEPPVGEVSRPSVIAWTTIFSTPASLAASARAGRCRWGLCTPPAGGLAERFLQNAILLQVAVSDRFVDPGQVLINNPPRAEIEMTDLGVSHLPFGQPHVLPARAQCRARIILIETVVKRRLRKQGRVTILFPVSFSARIDSPSIPDHEDDGSCHTPHSPDRRRAAQAISHGCGTDNA